MKATMDAAEAGAGATSANTTSVAKRLTENRLVAPLDFSFDTPEDYAYYFVVQGKNRDDPALQECFEALKKVF